MPADKVNEKERSRNAKAQKAHRERKRAYIQGLEEKVRRLEAAASEPGTSASRTSLLEQIEALTTENQQLKEIVDHLRPSLGDRPHDGSLAVSTTDERSRRATGGAYQLPEVNLKAASRTTNDLMEGSTAARSRNLSDFEQFSAAYAASQQHFPHLPPAAIAAVATDSAYSNLTMSTALQRWPQQSFAAPFQTPIQHLHLYGQHSPAFPTYQNSITHNQSYSQSPAQNSPQDGIGSQ